MESEAFQLFLYLEKKDIYWQCSCSELCVQFIDSFGSNIMGLSASPSAL